MRKLVVLLALPLQGCFFFYIPGSMLSGGYNACGPETVGVGQTLNIGGKVGKVEKISGRSERCQDGKLPILVSVNFEEGKSNVQEWERK